MCKELPQDVAGLAEQTDLAAGALSLRTSPGHHPAPHPQPQEPHFCTLGSGRFSRWMTMWAW